MTSAVLHRLSHSRGRPGRAARWLRHLPRSVSMPTPRVVVIPLLSVFIVARAVWSWFLRVFVAEPLFKAYCTEHGRGLRTDRFVHWVQGRGRLYVGNGVVIDGKCGFTFASRFCPDPTLRIGDGTAISNGCTFRVGKAITIGRRCRIAGYVLMFDSSGHPSDPTARAMGLPPDAGDVKAIAIGDNVWVGARAIIGPGVSIGEGSVIAAGAVVLTSVPPYTLVSGNPARRVAALARDQQTTPVEKLTEAVWIA